MTAQDEQAPWQGERVAHGASGPGDAWSPVALVRGQAASITSWPDLAARRSCSGRPVQPKIEGEGTASEIHQLSVLMARASAAILNVWMA